MSIQEESMTAPESWRQLELWPPRRFFEDGLLELQAVLSCEERYVQLVSLCRALDFANQGERLRARAQADFEYSELTHFFDRALEGSSDDS